MKSPAVMRRLVLAALLLAACASNTDPMTAHLTKACTVEDKVIEQLARHRSTAGEQEPRMVQAEREAAKAADLAGDDEFKQVDLHELDESIPQANRNLRADAASARGTPNTPDVLTTAGVGDVLGACSEVLKD